jgi:hypothetical protein
MPPKLRTKIQPAALRAKEKRHDVPEHIKQLVWIRAAGHCEQCGADLMVDLRSGRNVKLGDVAHIAPASPDGPRSFEDYLPEEAERLSSEPDNLMLLCPGDHRKTDRSPEAYPIANLEQHHLAHVAQIRHAAERGQTQRAEGLIVLGKHWATESAIRPRDLQEAMLAEGLWADAEPFVLNLPDPGGNGRDELYWRNVERSIDDRLVGRLNKSTSKQGDPLHLCVAALADMPSLMLIGRKLGDRSNRVQFSPSRDKTLGLKWPKQLANAPKFTFKLPNDWDGSIALVLSLSAEIADRDVLASVPDARIATFTTTTPNYDLLQTRGDLQAFRTAIQPLLSKLEAASELPIHVFPAMPAALAVEFGALLSTQHAHRYVIYDREGGSNGFVKATELGPR